MNIESIQQAITKLSPEELARFRAWFNEYESNVEPDQLNDPNPSIEDSLKRLRGSMKGKGLLKALMEDRRRESLL
jgi:hypothetical protein